jgi:hypothetical protein
MQLVFFTQVHENYAWDAEGNLGTGDKAYWKPKGGSEYLVNIGEGPFNTADIQKLARELLHKFECHNDMFQEHVIDWSLESDDFLTYNERMQMEYDGKIVYPALRVNLWQAMVMEAGSKC